jgi:hypothetical protein
LARINGLHVEENDKTNKVFLAESSFFKGKPSSAALEESGKHTFMVFTDYGGGRWGEFISAAGNT